MKTKRVIFFSVLLALFVGAGIGYYLFNKAPIDYKDVKAEYHFHAKDFLEEFEADENMANLIYLDRVIELNGIVISITHANQGKAYLSFIDPMTGISCTFDSLQAINLKEVQIGDEITLKGRCDGRLTDVRLSKCFLIEE